MHMARSAKSVDLGVDMKCNFCQKVFKRETSFIKHQCLKKKRFLNKEDVLELRCHFCKKEFEREASFIKHLCPRKKRFLDRDHQHSRLGFMAYQAFFKLNYRSTPNIDHFIKSNMYNDFIRFGRYMSEIKVADPSDFIKFVLDKGATLPIRSWPTDTVYETYIHYKNTTETPEVAIERAILLMHHWSVESGHHFRDFFRLIPNPLAVSLIRAGKISPWILYATKSGQELLQRFNADELNIVGRHVDPALWKRRIKLFAKDVESLSKILEEAGL